VTDRSARLLRSGTRLAGSLVISGGALWLAARKVHADELRWALSRATWVWLLPYPAICIVLNMVRGEIWRRLLGRRVTTGQAFWAYSVGFAANNVLPFRLGEAARVVVLSMRGQLPIVEVAAAAGLERLLDMGVLALMLGLLAPSVARVPGLGGGAAFVVVLVGIALAVIVALVRFRDPARRLFERATSWLPVAQRHAAVERWNELVRGLAVLLEPRIGVPAAAGAVLVWILTVLLQWLVLRAFQPAAGAADAAFMVVAVSLAIALPAAPGFIGVYHWAGQQSLLAAFPQLYDPSVALAAATVAHAASFATGTVLGIIGLWYFGLAPSTLARALRDRTRSQADHDDRDLIEVDPIAGITN
jgi:uncharacterized protein (TIRG00374 family)